MTKIEVTLSSEYGIMFLFDSKVRPKFPAESGKEPVMWTSTCLSFRVLIYVDGDAKITLCDDSEETNCTEYFTGEIECPSKVLSLYDHNGLAFASVPLEDGHARVSLRMSDEESPGVVECVIRNMKTF